MVTQLRVVNDCLAIMGETPLTTLNEEHEYKAAALSRLAAESRRIQSRKGVGWWFNAEEATVSVNPSDSRIYLPGDVATVTVLSERPRVVQRGRVLYNLSKGTDRWDAGTSFEVRLIRELPIDIVPVTVAELIAHSAMLRFQSDYDGDQTKTRNLMTMIADLEADAISEHMRQRKVNMLDNSVGLSRIRNIIRQARRY